MSTLRCHCGAVRIAARLSEPPEAARRCNCSFCMKRGAATVFASEVQVLRGDPTLYRWGTGQEHHWFCGTCGIYTHHRRAGDAGYGVNLGALEGVEAQSVEPVWVDGRNWSPPIR